MTSQALLTPTTGPDSLILKSWRNTADCLQARPSYRMDGRVGKGDEGAREKLQKNLVAIANAVASRTIYMLICIGAQCVRGEGGGRAHRYLTCADSVHTRQFSR